MNLPLDPAVADESVAGQGSVSDTLYARIRGDILFGVLKPGAKLKLEAMRADYEASVNTLRETLSRLASEGLVISEGQRGFQVVPATLADLTDITGVRLMLECQAARLSLARADLDWEARLVGAYHKLSRIEALVETDPERASAQLETCNRAFHMALVDGCGSRWLMTFHGIMYDQSLRYRMLAFKVRHFPREKSRQEHRQILDLALARDMTRLEQVLVEHITKGANLYGEADLADGKRVDAP